jgi:carbon storage regulator CsrA
MLRLKMKEDTTLVINDNITIKFFDIKAGSCGIGVDAPRDIPVFRGNLQAERDAAREAERRNIPAT